MFGLEILEVGIGLVFMYLTISLICSGIVEAFQKVTRFRAKHLKQALGELLADPNNNGFVKLLYDHHLIKTPFQDKTGGVTWIDGKKFAKAILDIATEGKSSGEYQAVLSTIKGIQGHDDMRDRLLKLLTATSDKAETMEKRVENWFNESMEEVGRWYLKRIRTIVSIVGILVVGAMNADTIHIAKSLWNDNELREATVTAANTYAEGLETRLQEAETDSVVFEFSKTLHQIEGDIAEAKVLPVGWYKAELPYGKKDADPILFWLLKIAGLLMTMGAVSLGSPYWYAQMKSLLNLRFQVLGGGSKEAPPAAPAASPTSPAPTSPIAPMAVETTEKPKPPEGDKPATVG
jgi:hypothetical protein